MTDEGLPGGRTLGWKHLPWDSEFLGVSIGSVRLDGAESDDLIKLEDEARAAGIECLYGFLDPAEPERTVVVQRYGWRFVEAASMFDLKVSEPRIPRPDGYEFAQGTIDDLPHIGEVVSKMALWGRFAVDPRFGLEQSRRMQMAWAERGLGDDDRHSILVARSEGEIVAFVGKVDDEVVWCDAVGTTRRGSGAARYLMQMLRDLAGDERLVSGTAAARNINVHRYVANCGFRVKQVEYIYHRWLDEPRSI